MATPVCTVTADDVIAWGKITDVDTVRRAILNDIIAAVWAVVMETSVEWGESDEDVEDRLAATEQGVVMMAFRVWTRKGSPEGAAGFGRDQSLIRVVRSDPDVEFFLGPWSLDEIPV